MASLRKHKLSVFLIKQDYQAATDFIAPEIGHSVQIPLTSEITGTLFYSTSHPTPPTWASIFEGIPEFDNAKILNQHSKALLVFKTNERWFCFTFGYAKHLINQGAYERNFGLIVALNLSDPSIKPEGSDFEVCIAIMSNQAGALDLPFFSKVSIKNAVSTIRGFGYKVTKLKINRFT